MTELRSKEIRKVGWEIDALRLGTDWKEDELDGPQILIDSTYGFSHPGSRHLNELATEVEQAVGESGGKGARFYVTDICDGIAQGHEGMNYSLLSRELIASMVEVHYRANPFDGVVLCSSCDKAVPAHLIAAARLGAPVIHLPGGAMPCGPSGLTLEQMGVYGLKLSKGEITRDEFIACQREACPGCGACQFMGTASTMQVMSEALGLALPGTALTPTDIPRIGENAGAVGRAILKLVESGLTSRDILTPAAFHNALVVHAAIGGSTNAFLHLPAVAHEVGIKITPDQINEINATVPYLVNVRPSGQYPSQLFWYAGGVPALMLELKQFLDLDALTVTGKSVGENLRDIEKSSFIDEARGYLRQLDVRPEQVIRSLDNLLNTTGALAILSGNLATSGAVVKYSAISEKMRRFVGPARPFDSQQDALAAVVRGQIKPGEVIIVRYEGPKGSGMPEMFYLTEALASNPELVETTAIVTDGRFSGATRGPNIGHVSPEAAEGGAIALIEEGDLVRIDIPGKRIDLVGTHGLEQTPEQIATVLSARRSRWKPQSKKRTGILDVFSKLAASPMEGAYLKA